MEIWDLENNFLKVSFPVGYILMCEMQHWV